MDKTSTTSPAYTAGQWSVFDDDRPSVFAQIGNENVELCEMSSLQPKNERSANARLIAAAPELLEELIEARTAIGDFYGVDLAAAGQHFGAAMLNRMSMLIAKTEGR